MIEWTYRLKRSVRLLAEEPVVLSNLAVAVPAPCPGSKLAEETFTRGHVMDGGRGVRTWELGSCGTWRDRPLSYEATLRVREALVEGHDAPYPLAPHDAPPEALEASPLVESDAPCIEELARHALGNVERFLDAILALGDATRGALSYSSDALFVRSAQSAVTALKAGEGVCDEHSHLFAALCRSAGIPCLVVTGLGFAEGEAPVAHAWNMVSPDGESWWPVDCTGAVEVSFFSERRVPTWVGADCAVGRTPQVAWRVPAKGVRGEVDVTVKDVVEVLERPEMGLKVRRAQASWTSDGRVSLDLELVYGQPEPPERLLLRVWSAREVKIGPLESTPHHEIVDLDPSGVGALRVLLGFSYSRSALTSVVLPVRIEAPGAECGLRVMQSGGQLSCALGSGELTSA